ncbi:hypothetical protein [Salinimicrobium sp. GXAS 041]|uniref:hypothetical protein n=1 Tax=Salinimicrobium sp. GXAS 041 TaxID=3400806 RepID=UPI003C7215CC
MGFFDQNKALIITVLLLSLLLLLMYNIQLSNTKKERQETLVDLENFKVEEPEVEKAPEPAEEQEPSAPQPSQQRTHQAYNQNQQQRTSDFETRLQEIFERNASQQTASETDEATTSEGDVNLNTNKQEKAQQQSDGDDFSEEISPNTGNYRNSSISFSLVGRSAYQIPNPIYTCDTRGKIVVNILVNEEGRVINTSINKVSSTSSNECLVDRALDYAAGASFSRLSGRNEQKGTITYYFQGQ